MATASSMVLSALIALGEKQIGDTLSSAEQTHYLSKLNAMLDSWSIERLLVYQILQESLALTAGTVSYTIGSGGAFNTTRPTRITYAFIRDSNSADTNLELINYQAYADLVLKSTGNTYPRYLFYDTADVAGLATLRLYPAPQASLTLYIQSWKQLQSFAAIGDTVVLPAGYQRAIEANFVIEAAPGFLPASDEAVSIAKESKAAIQRMNAPNPVMKMDVGITRGRRNSIITGP